LVTKFGDTSVGVTLH